MHTVASPNVIGGARPEKAAHKAAESGQPDSEVSGLVAVRAPMVGTFYRAPKPGAPPFVDVGSTVGEHTVIGIVETMKLMNSVSAGVSGKVVEICVADGELIQAQHILMRVRQGES